MTVTQPVPQLEEKKILKIALTALSGTTIEWYDFFIYATAAALVFPALFFASDVPPLVGVMLAFSTFAVGFIARRLGALCLVTGATALGASEHSSWH